MIAENLAIQAEKLTPEQQSLLGLLMAWLCSPLLRLDRTPYGHQRQDACLQLLDDAFAHRNDPGEMRRLEAEVKASDELSQSEEPEGPALYRLDVMATLHYAIRALTERSFQELAWCFQRVEESIEFAMENDLVPESWEPEDAIVAAIAAIESMPTHDDVSVSSLKEILKPAYDALSAALADGDAR